LGYAFSAPSKVVLDRNRQAMLVVKIFDRNGRPVTGARVSASGFPNAFSEDISQLQFSERAPGVYAAPVKSRHAGLWEFRVTMDNGADRATTILRSDLILGGAA
jgi:nitrogen fixation protein FixH